LLAIFRAFFRSQSIAKINGGRHLAELTADPQQDAVFAMKNEESKEISENETELWSICETQNMAWDYFRFDLLSGGSLRLKRSFSDRSALLNPR
jgi:hypothetical protein